jgi:hypothetical protein
MLDKLLEENEFLAVYFCKYICKLTGLEIVKWGTKMFYLIFVGFLFIITFFKCPKFSGSHENWFKTKIVENSHIN